MEFLISEEQIQKAAANLSKNPSWEKRVAAFNYWGWGEGLLGSIQVLEKTGDSFFRAKTKVTEKVVGVKTAPPMVVHASPLHEELIERFTRLCSAGS